MVCWTAGCLSSVPRGRRGVVRTVRFGERHGARQGEFGAANSAVSIVAGHHQVVVDESVGATGIFGLGSFARQQQLEERSARPVRHGHQTSQMCLDN
jgi:hypothetical protein